MWLRSVGLSSLCTGILFFSFPFTSRAQSSGTHALDAQNVAAVAPDNVLTTESASKIYEQRAVDFPPSLSSGPAWNVGALNRVDEPSQANPAGEAHVELLPLFERWHTDMANRPVDLQSEEGPERYHWKGLSWQSLAFIGVENAYRFSTDYYARHLLATGPYWRDYGISMTHWDMDRWSDGDDFLVDDIGHPMQGAVSGFIEIQNSPTARNLRISTSSAYWRSRLISLIWMNVYSVQQKIGPMGEAAIGNAGGYTYPLHCAYPCKTPGVKYTNNTGWTDFIMTPAGGTVWVIGEDFIDRFVSDRIQGDSNGLFPKIVRGTLNPTRTAANLLRGRNPWYRDYEHPDVPGAGGVHFERSDEDVIRHLPRYEIFPHFNGLALMVNTTACTQCRRWTNGGGAGFSARLSRWVDFDSDVDYQPNASPLPSFRAGGDVLMSTFGFRSGIQTPHYALKASLRPGFVSYNREYLTMPSTTNPVPETGRVTHFATALAINGDYGIARHLAVRATFGNTPVRFLDHYIEPPGIGKPPYVNWLSHEYIGTNENWAYQLGPVLRF